MDCTQYVLRLESSLPQELDFRNVCLQKGIDMHIRVTIINYNNVFGSCFRAHRIQQLLENGLRLNKGNLFLTFMYTLSGSVFSNGYCQKINTR